MYNQAKQKISSSHTRTINMVSSLKNQMQSIKYNENTILWSRQDLKNVCTLSWPPTSQTVKLMFLYSTVSTLNPGDKNLFNIKHEKQNFDQQKLKRAGEDYIKSKTTYKYKKHWQKLWFEESLKLTDGRDGGDDLTKLQLVQNSGLTSSIKTYHQNPHFFLGKKPAEQLREIKPHFPLASPKIQSKPQYN